MAERIMPKLPGLLMLVMLALTLGGCVETSVMNAPASVSPPEYSKPLSLVSLPAAGYIELGPVDAGELDRLGLGGPSPVLDPPSSPFNSYGMYWSERFALIEGDAVEVTIYNNAPVSWFGVDWSPRDVRGILATICVDEDGRSFNPQYPASSSVDQGTSGYKLTVDYEIPNDTECVLVVKNNVPDSPQRLAVAVSLRPSVSVRRIVGKIPLLKNLVSPEEGPEGEGD